MSAGRSFVERATIKQQLCGYIYILKEKSIYIIESASTRVSFYKTYLLFTIFAFIFLCCLCLDFRNVRKLDRHNTERCGEQGKHSIVVPTHP